MPTADILAKIGLDSSGLNTGLKDAKSKVAAFGESFGGLKNIIAGAFSAGAIVAFVKSMGDYSERILNLSSVTGLSTDSVQALSFSLTQNGGSIESLTGAMAKLKKAQAEAIAGNQSQIETFNNLGISVNDLATASPEQIFDAIAKAYVNGDASGAAFAASTKILGKDLSEMNGTLIEIASQGLPAYIDTLKQAGQVMDEKSLKGWDKFVDGIGRGVNWIKMRLGDLAVNIDNTYQLFNAMSKYNLSFADAGTLVGLRQAGEEEIAAIEQGNLEADKKAKAEAIARANAEKEFWAKQGKVMDEVEKQEFQRLSATQQIAKLEKEILGLKQQEESLWEKGDRLGALDKQLEQIKKMSELEKLQGKEKDDKAKKAEADKKQIESVKEKVADLRADASKRIGELSLGVKAFEPANNLARIGGFIGNQADARIDRLVQTNSILTETKRIQLETLGEIKKLNGGKSGAVFS